MPKMIESLNEIIRLQAEIIDRLFILLIQHIEVEDIDRELSMIRTVALKNDKIL